ncbi:hypothetical protein R6Q57_012972 [Mikania cordata]
MATKVVYTVREDKQRLQKQLGCINGVFHLLDRGYLLGLHRNCRNRNRLTTDHGEKELKKSSEKSNKEKKQKKMMIEKNRASVESSRNSCSSSCSSTTLSSFDCSKWVQTEWQLPSEPTSPNLHKKQQEWSLPPPDIRDVVKDSMTKVTRVRKDERAGSVMKHVDSPRPFIHQSDIQYKRKDKKLAKIQKISPAVDGTSRFSCDERESKYSLKSSFKVKELPRLSLDGKQNSKVNSKYESRSEPGSNKKPSSGIVARLMGLDTLTGSISEAETVKVKLDFGAQLDSSSRRVHLKIKPALQQLEHGDRDPKKQSVYGEMSALGFKTSREDLRAHKQIVEEMQMTKTVFDNKEQSLNGQKNDQPGSPMVKGTSSPTRHELLNQAVKQIKTAKEPMMVMGLHYVNHKARKQVKDQTPTNNKATRRTTRSLQDQNGERAISSPRTQRSKNGIDKQCLNGSSTDSSRIKKQSNLKTKNLKIKHINPMQNNNQSCMCSNETRISREDGDTFISSKSERKHDQVTRVSENNLAERLIEDKPNVELAKLTMEQASPVSVLDAFYVEDIPSPVKKKADAFNDYDIIRVDETEWNQVGIYNLVTSTDAGDFHQTKLFNSIDDGAKSPTKTTNGDHKYIREILSASGFLKDPESSFKIAQLHSTCRLINPELFNILEKTNDEHHKDNQRSKSNDKVRRKLIFDSVNDILVHKLAKPGLSGERLVDGEKLLTELWLEIDDLQSGSDRCIYDEAKIIVTADLNKSSQDWDKYYYEVPGVVLDIECLIFKELINEIVNTDVVVTQDRLVRRLFAM